MNKRFLSLLSMLLLLNIFVLASEPCSNDSKFSDCESKQVQDKESLDVHQINSSVDAGSFYSVDVSITQLEENFVKMAQQLKHLKQQIEFAKQAEQKRLVQIQKLERENAKLCQTWLDNSWTGSSAKLEQSNPEANIENKSSDFESVQAMGDDSTGHDTITEQAALIQPVAVRQDVVVEVVNPKTN